MFQPDGINGDINVILWSLQVTGTRTRTAHLGGVMKSGMKTAARRHHPTLALQNALQETGS